MKLKCINCGELIDMADGRGNYNQGYSCLACGHVMYPREMKDEPFTIKDDVKIYTEYEDKEEKK